MLSRNLKNVLVVSVGFLFLFMAAGGLQNLQVSKMMHNDGASGAPAL